MPKLSIILTSRDRYELLRFAVASVFAQTYEDWELIIVDDDSRDRRVRDYYREIEDGRRVVVHRGRPVSKQYRAAHKMNAIRINAGLGICKSEYISYLCDDDEYLPDRCGRMVDYLDEHKGVGMVVDSVRWIMFDGRELRQDSFRYVYREPYEEGHEELLRAIAPSTFICHDSVMHRRPRPCCGRWETDLRSHTPVDWRYWLQLLNDGYVVKKLDAVGERAYFPGTWRHHKPADVLAFRRSLEIMPGKETDMAGKKRRMEKRKREQQKAKRSKSTGKEGAQWAINTSGKNLQVSDATLPKPLFVKADERVKADRVMVRDSMGRPKRLYPGFSMDTAPEKPTLREALRTKPEQGEVKYRRKTGGGLEMEEVEPEPEQPEPERPRPAKVPAPKPRRKLVASGAGEVEEKTPFEEEAEEAPAGRVCSGCGKPIYAGSKTGLCRECYWASRRKG